MDLVDGDPFETDSPGEAARQFRLTLGALVGSLVLWVVALELYARVPAVDGVPFSVVLAVAVLGFVVECCLLVAVTRSALEYGAWLSRRIDWVNGSR